MFTKKEMKKILTELYKKWDTQVYEVLIPCCSDCVCSSHLRFKIKITDGPERGDRHLNTILNLQPQEVPTRERTKKVYEVKSGMEQVSSEPLFSFSFNKETREHQTKLAAGRFKIKQIEGSSSSYNVYLSCRTHCHSPNGSQEFTQTKRRLDEFMQEKFIKHYLSLFLRQF